MKSNIVIIKKYIFQKVATYIKCTILLLLLLFILEVIPNFLLKR